MTVADKRDDVPGPAPVLTRVKPRSPVAAGPRPDVECRALRSRLQKTPVQHDAAAEPSAGRFALRDTRRHRPRHERAPLTTCTLTRARTTLTLTLTLTLILPYPLSLPLTCSLAYICSLGAACRASRFA